MRKVVERWMVRVLLALLGVLEPTAALAQDSPRVSARIASERVFVGDPVILEVVVDGSLDAAAPSLEGLDGLTAEYLGDDNRSMTTSMDFNGRRTRSETLQYVFRYAVTPRRKGPLQIPPITIMVEGRALTTQPVWFEAVGPQANDDFVLRVEPAAKRAYVGQPVPVRFTWYIGASVQSFRFSGPDASGHFDLASPTDPRATRPGASPRSFLDFTFLGHAAVGEHGEGRLNGRTFRTLSFDQIVVPRRPGSVSIGPFNIAFDQVVGQSRDIFSRDQTRRVVIASDPVTLEVLPLPTAGQPADFSGLVGEFSLSAQAAPSEASVGDPIALVVRIRGPEPMADVHPPDLGRLPGFNDDFKLSTEGWTEEPPSAPGERVFRTTIRARSPSVSQVPSIGIPCFDPGTAEYRRAETLAIPLHIWATTVVTAADAVGSLEADAGPRLAALERVPLGDGAQGIVEGVRGPGNLSETVETLAWLTGPAGISALAAPVVVFTVVALWTPARRALRHPGRRNLARAVGHARKHSASAERIAEAVHGYIGRACSRPPGALTSRDCVSLVADRAPESAPIIAALLDECEGVRYGRRHIDSDSLSKRAVDSLRRLDRELRRSV